MRFLHCWLLLVALGFRMITSAQVKTNFNSEEKLTARGKFKKEYPAAIDLELPAKDIKQLLAKEGKEKEEKEDKILRIAELIPLAVDMPKEIQWTFDELYAFGKYTVKAKDALSVSIDFDQFYLPEGTEMYVYNEDGNMITGPVTSAENNDVMTWGSWVYDGDQVTIELKTPIESKEQLKLHASSIAYGYKKIYKVGRFGQSGSCEVNVLCPLGTGWEGERNSVALILIANGAGVASGAMVMNACGTNQPFFLTAGHVHDTDPVVAGWRFTFQAWSPACSPTQNSEGISFNGASFRAKNAATDFCLVELNSVPPASSGIRYAGWNRSAIPATQATAIHHPAGDVMKISRDNNGVVRATAYGYVDSHWRADWSPQSNGAGQTVIPVTESGSSGSPLFDQNHRLIGQLHDGPSVCGGAQLWDFYGSFDLSWASGSSINTRLSNWLDPTNTGAITTNTTNVASLANFRFDIAGSAAVCGTQSYTYSVNTTLPVTWTVSPQNMVTKTDNGNTTTLTKINDGLITLTATVNSGCGTGLNASKTIATGLPSFIGTSKFASGSTPQTLSSVNYMYSNIADITLDNPLSKYAYYNWTLSQGTIYSWTQDHTYGSVHIDLGAGAPAGKNFTLKLQAYNSCGTLNENHYVYFQGCSGCRYTVSPNPARTELTVSTTEESILPQTSKHFNRIQLLDKTGKIVLDKEYPADSKKGNLNVSLLKPDVYILRIFDNNIPEERKVIIQH